MRRTKSQKRYSQVRGPRFDLNAVFITTTLRYACALTKDFCFPPEYLRPKTMPAIVEDFISLPRDMDVNLIPMFTVLQNCDETKRKVTRCPIPVTIPLQRLEAKKLPTFSILTLIASSSFFFRPLLLNLLIHLTSLRSAELD